MSYVDNEINLILYMSGGSSGPVVQVSAWCVVVSRGSLSEQLCPMSIDK